jgi:hypothetical protein
MLVALLLNLLILVLSFLRNTKGDPDDSFLHLRKRFLREIAINLSFAIFTALVIVGIAITALFGLNKDQDLVGYVPTVLLVTGIVLLMLTLVMILRRIYTLVLHEFEAHKLDT